MSAHAHEEKKDLTRSEFWTALGLSIGFVFLGLALAESYPGHSSWIGPGRFFQSVSTVNGIFFLFGIPCLAAAMIIGKKLPLLAVVVIAFTYWVARNHF